MIDLSDWAERTVSHLPQSGENRFIKFTCYGNSINTKKKVTKMSQVFTKSGEKSHDEVSGVSHCILVVLIFQFAAVVLEKCAN